MNPARPESIRPLWEGFRRFFVATRDAELIAYVDTSDDEVPVRNLVVEVALDGSFRRVIYSPQADEMVSFAGFTADGGYLVAVDVYHYDTVTTYSLRIRPNEAPRLLEPDPDTCYLSHSSASGNLLAFSCHSTEIRELSTGAGKVLPSRGYIFVAFDGLEESTMLFDRNTHRIAQLVHGSWSLRPIIDLPPDRPFFDYAP